MSTQTQLPPVIHDLTLPWQGEGRSKARTVIKDELLEVVQLFVPAGWDIPTHQSPGHVTIHCLKGKVVVNAAGKKLDLAAGTLIHIPHRESHSMKGIDDASVLLTIAVPPPKFDCAGDPIEEASEESFPASDPPARSPITGT